MAAFDRCKACLIICKSWHGKTFELCVKLKDKSKTFQKEHAEADHNYHFPSDRPSKPIKVRLRRSAGLRLVSRFWFIRTTEWLQCFEYTPAALGFKTTLFNDEAGAQNIEGVVVGIPEGANPNEFRNVEQFSEQVQDIVEDVCTPGQQLRAQESTETFQRLNSMAQARLTPDCT
jgi:hypothetical protein